MRTAGAFAWLVAGRPRLEREQVQGVVVIEPLALGHGDAVAIADDIGRTQDGEAVVDADSHGTTEIVELETLRATDAVLLVDGVIDRIDHHLPPLREAAERLGALTQDAAADADAVGLDLEDFAVPRVNGVRVGTAASRAAADDDLHAGGPARARESAGRAGGFGRTRGVATLGIDDLVDVDRTAAASGSRAIVVAGQRPDGADAEDDEGDDGCGTEDPRTHVAVVDEREGTGVVTAVAATATVVAVIVIMAVAIIVATATVTTAALRVVGGLLGRIVALALKVVDLRLDVHSLPAGGRVVAIGVGLNPGGQLPVDALARTFSGDFLVVVVVDDVGGREGLDRSGLWSGRVEGLEGFVVPHVLAHALRRVDRPLGAVRRLFGGGERVGVVREGVAEFDEPGVNGRDGLVRRADVFRALLVFADDTVDSGVEVSEGGAGIRLVVVGIVRHGVVLRIDWWNRQSLFLDDDLACGRVSECARQVGRFVVKQELGDDVGLDVSRDDNDLPILAQNAKIRNCDAVVDGGRVAPLLDGFGRTLAAGDCHGGIGHWFLHVVT